MAADTNPVLLHQIDFMLYNLPETTVRIDFPVAAVAEIMMLAAMPSVRIGANYIASAIVINNLLIQPRRLQFEVANTPALLPITLQILCRGPFVFGWLRVPETVQTVIATAAQQIRIVGPSYWAVPLGPGAVAPEPAAPQPAVPEPGPNPPTAKPAGSSPPAKSDPASAKAATEFGGAEPGSNSAAAKPAENKVRQSERLPLPQAATEPTAP